MFRREALMVLASLTLFLAGSQPPIEAAPPVRVEFLTLVRTEHPMVRQPGAKVVIREKISQRVVASGYTDQSGEFICYLTSGKDYLVSAQKNRLNGYSNVHLNPAPKARTTVVVR